MIRGADHHLHHHGEDRLHRVLHYLSKDTIDIFSSTKIDDLNPSSYAFVNEAGINKELTVLQQLRELDRLAKAGDTAAGEQKQRIEDQLLEHLYPPQYNYKVSFNQLEDTSSSRIVVVSRRLVASATVSG